MNNDLYQLRALANFTREFDADIAKLREAGGKPPLSLAGVNVLKLFCKAKNERLVMLDSLKGVLGLEGGKDAVYDVRALTLAHNLAHQLPAKLFQDEEARQRLLAAGQKMLDAALELEDSLAEEG
jgi:type III secretion system TyeA family effector delivery regulator